MQIVRGCNSDDKVPFGLNCNIFCVSVSYFSEKSIQDYEVHKFPFCVRQSYEIFDQLRNLEAAYIYYSWIVYYSWNETDAIGSVIVTYFY